MTTIDQALCRLIHERSCRRAFFEAPESVFDLPPEDTESLRAIDETTLSELARSVAEDVLSRGHSGSGGLLDLFPKTVEAFRTTQGDSDALLELAYRFMESPAFAEYREVPHCGLGTSLEEAFYRFAETANIGDARTREHEFLAAMAKLLCMSPHAAITLPPELRRTPHGHYGVSSRDGPTLYGALRGRFVTGPLTPFLADLMAPKADFAATAERHGVPGAVLTESLRRLAVLGIF